MNRLLAALRQHAMNIPAQVALNDSDGAHTYGDLLFDVEFLAKRLRTTKHRSIAILADNSAAWVIADLAAHVAGIPCIPIPHFFSTSQIAHVIAMAGVDYVITDRPGHLLRALHLTDVEAKHFHSGLQSISLPISANIRLPAGTSKITFTSGTTGEPKGVCLGQQELEAVAESLKIVSQASRSDRHLCLLPLATLLENVGGIYTAILTGATVCVPRLAEVGLNGSSDLNVGKMIAALDSWQATSAILVPQMLHAMVTAAKRGVALPVSLRYLAVGGAPVSSRLLEEADALNLPVYEGYGLSECASVVAVNRPGDRRAGTVGKPLPHVRLEFAPDGEILIRGQAWRGYLGVTDTIASSEPIATGDTGHLDEDGFLRLTGRKKQMFISAYGRNISPEWVESELTSAPSIAQAAVFGEARPFNSAVIVTHPGTTPDMVSAAIAEANGRLPDYARVHAWIPAHEPFSPANDMATTNGRPRRTAIWNAHADQIEALYRP